MEPKTKQVITKISNELEQRIKSLVDLCESPIEEFFLINIIQYFYSQSLMSLDFKFMVKWINDPYGISTGKPEKFNYQEEGIDVFGFIYGLKITPEKGVTYKIIPQYEFKNYRIDFAIIIEKPDSVTKFCVECDGIDYHKTSEQLKRDHHRSRDLAGDGWITLRYTGSELFNWGRQNALEFEVILVNFLKNNK